jgi:GNAT superfamily N-acetyltransferase
MNTLPAGYEQTLDRSRIDSVAAHAYLTRSYWAKGIPLETVERAIVGSICVAVFHSGRQVAFARTVSDRATFAYLADVYVLSGHEGQGIARAMICALRAHPELQGLRRWLLFTADAHGVYEKLGFSPLAHPERGMEIVDSRVYSQ